MLGYGPDKVNAQCTTVLKHVEFISTFVKVLVKSAKCLLTYLLTDCLINAVK